jgi:hypothetical protein
MIKMIVIGQCVEVNCIPHFQIVNGQHMCNARFIQHWNLFKITIVNPYNNIMMTDIRDLSNNQFTGGVRFNNSNPPLQYLWDI